MLPSFKQTKMTHAMRRFYGAQQMSDAADKTESAF